MRWLFIEPTNLAEVQCRADTLRAIDAWWAAFVETSQARRFQDLFSQQIQWDLPEWMHQHLAAVHPQLMWEFGPGVAGKEHRLVITPESEHWLRPLLATLLERAPQLDDWEFYPHRLPEDESVAEVTVQARTEGELTGATVSVRGGKDNLIDLLFQFPAEAQADPQAAHSAAFVATETLLGEDTLDRWIGAIEVTFAAKQGWLGRVLGKSDGEKPERFLALDRLKPTVDAVADSIVSQLPSRPCYEWAEEGEWTVIELSRSEADEYPERDDLLVAVTGYLPMWEATQRRSIFESQCFSRHGEVFCYLKIDGADGLPDECPFEDRGEIEDAINARLRTRQLGTVIGGGTGLRYSYIDLALTDLKPAAMAVRDLLRENHLPVRTWLLFFDSIYQHEWLGIYDDTPAPPVRAED